jgi:hypothetical protein
VWTFGSSSAKPDDIDLPNLLRRIQCHFKDRQENIQVVGSDDIAAMVITPCIKNTVYCDVVRTDVTYKRIASIITVQNSAS